jgi:hypothetical protein
LTFAFKTLHKLLEPLLIPLSLSEPLPLLPFAGSTRLVGLLAVSFVFDMAAAIAAAA